MIVIMVPARVGVILSTFIAANYIQCHPVSIPLPSVAANIYFDYKKSKCIGLMGIEWP